MAAIGIKFQSSLLYAVRLKKLSHFEWIKFQRGHLYRVQEESQDPVYTVPHKFLNEFFTCSICLHGTLQILLQLAVLFAVQKLARFLGSRVNERWIRARFCPFKNLSRPLKTGSKLTEILTTSRVNSLLFRNHYSLRAIACSRLTDSGEEAKVKSTRESLAGRFVFVFYFRV